MNTEVVLKAAFTKRFGRVSSPQFALDVAFQADPGVTVLFGPSGAGKTTALRCLAGLLRPDGGTIVLGGRVLFDAEKNIDLPPRQRSVGCVFQKPALFPHLTVEENVGYALRHLAQPAKVRVVRELLELFGIAGLAHRLPGEISGGEYQRAALARALAPGPVLLLLDEPLAALDWPTRQRIVAELQQWLRRHPIPVLYVTHDPYEATVLGQQVLVIERGRLRHGLPQPASLLAADPSAGTNDRENIFEAETMAGAHDGQATLCRLLPNGETIEVPFSARVGARVRIAVEAKDVLLATEPPRGLAVSNILPGVVAHCPAAHELIVRSHSGLLWRVKLPAAASGQTTFSASQPVWLIIPPHRCKVFPA